jgi:hypothetical protein
MNEKRRVIVSGIDTYREGTRWSWYAAGLDWQWQNVGGGGQVRCTTPELVPADAGHYCESITDAVMYSVGFGEGYAYGSAPGKRIMVPLNNRPPGPVPPAIAEPAGTPPPPPAIPVPPKGGK